ncbi:glycoside hydrolase family 43 protein [Niabella insulamsoli]|uniref:glycoside hydrolase family 43 protein n=1 Tax=Niabella insulamsoli TaxID=3144874 RepID=UPI0031FD9051
MYFQRRWPVLIGIVVWLCLPMISNVFAQGGGKKNPLVADPTIFVDNGIYYLYGTGGGAKDQGFKVFTSTDKKVWTDKGFALTKNDNYGTRGFWAPQVFKHQGKYYMAYTASEHIAISQADTPLGPFKQKAKVPIDSNIRMIDPFVWIDPSGVIYLYHVRLQKGNRIFVAEMSEDFSSIKPASLKACIDAEAGWEDTQNANWKVAEGPTLLKHGGFYYLIYSANDFRNPDYAVGYATASSLLGPWKKSNSNPIISRKNLKYSGTGHGDILKDSTGTMWYVFHTHQSEQSVAPRKTAMVQVAFEKQGGKQPDRLIILPDTFKFLEKAN